MTLTEIGALIGAVTGAFTVLDRFVLGRLYVSIRRNDNRLRDLVCINTSKHDMLITNVWARPNWVGVASGTSMEAIYEMLINEGNPILLLAGETRELPITIRKGELLDKDCTELRPFVIVVSWRKTRSVWLPQIPIVIFSSAKALRRLGAAK